MQTERVRRRPRAETRAALLEAAARAFAHKGFHGTSVETVSEAAGFSRGAFYSNFKSKEQLFVELLHERVYESYRQMLVRLPKDVSPVERLRWGGRALKERYEREEDRWLFELWLECLAHAVRHPEFRSLAATFWSGNRASMAPQVSEAFRDAGRAPPCDPKDIATAVIALDIGLKIQNLVDPEEVPLELYPKLYEVLFGSWVDPER